MLTMSQKNDLRKAQENRLNRILSGVIYNDTVDQHQKVMVDWFVNKYLPMPEWEKQEVRDQWDQYYKLCKQSVEAELLREIKVAAKDKNDKRVQELAQQARDMLKKGFVKIPEPSGYDPEIWDTSQWANDCRVLTHILNGESNDFDKKVSTNIY